MTKARRPGVAYDDQTAPLSSHARPAPLPVRLRAQDGSGRSFLLTTGSALVGTSKGAHLCLEAKAVSRQHCEVELTAEGVVVSDLKSRNGTFYLGHRVERIVLGPGASFAVGNVQVTIETALDRAAIPPTPLTEIEGLQGTSLAMRRLLGLVDRLRGSLVPVLVEGESGSGKTTCARAIHATSTVSGGPFVVVPCASLARDAQRAELFEGTAESPPAFRRARGGTLFLRGIEFLSMSLQPALLETIEASASTGESTPLAGQAVRIIASTTGSLAESVDRGAFHAGLFYRLGSLKLVVPPLRERREDIPLMAASFARSAGIAMEPALLNELANRPWPGNVRELRGALAAHAAIGVLPPRAAPREGLLDLALDEIVDPTKPYAEAKDALVDRFTARYLEALLEHTDQNQSLAAKLAGLDRSYLGRLIAKYGIKR